MKDVPGEKKVKVALWVTLLILTGITCIKPIYPEQMCLQHIGTLLLLIPLFNDALRNRMPLSAFICMFMFTVLHLVGARYIYSYVPYREWASCIGVVIPDCGRNHYDRLVHFSFGLLMFPYFLHKAMGWVDRKPLISVLIAWLFIQSASMIYEIFEWQLSVWSGQGADYNGQQGDIWDAQKDMALALVGSVVSGVYYAVRNRFGRKRGLLTVVALCVVSGALTARAALGSADCKPQDTRFVAVSYAKLIDAKSYKLCFSKDVFVLLDLLKAYPDGERVVFCFDGVIGVRDQRCQCELSISSIPKVSKGGMELSKFQFDSFDVKGAIKTGSGDPLVTADSVFDRIVRRIKMMPIPLNCDSNELVCMKASGIEAR